MKQRTLLSIGLILFSVLKMQAQQVINPNLLGENAWLPTLLYGSTAGGGRLDYQWTNITASGAKMIRYGGTAFNQTQPPPGDYTHHVNKIKGAGCIPVIQVAMGDLTTAPTYATGIKAKEVVTLLNSGGPTSSTYCKYWVIGNEPDLVGFSAMQIRDKIRDISQAMRNQNLLYTSDPLVIIGPELAYYNTPYITALTTTYSILQYINIFSFHYYPFNDEGVFNGNILAPTRANVIGTPAQILNNPANNPVNPVRTNIQSLKDIIALSAFQNVKVGITEANICGANDVNNNYVATGGLAANATNDSYGGNGANSFIAGQLWAELISICMEKNVELLNFWSVIEGDPNSAPRLNYKNIGYIQNQSPYNFKSTYQHYKMVAENFSTCTNYYTGTDNQLNLKAFGAKNGSKMVVVILNQDASAMNYTLRLDNSTPTGTYIKMNFPGTITTPQYIGSIDPKSTQVLVFDCKGNLSKKIDYKESGGSTGAPVPTNYSATILTADAGSDKTPICTCCIPSGCTTVIGTAAQANRTYSWSPTTYLSSPTVAQPTVTPPINFVTHTT